MRFSAICKVSSLITYLLLSNAVAQPLTGNSTEQGTPGVFGDNATGGDGIFGSGGAVGRGAVGTSGSGTGVEGNSKTGIAVYGSSSTTGRGVVGVTKSNTAVEGDSESGVGVWGTTKGATTAGGEFHNSGGGDLIRAGEGEAFRVLNNGDVLVRGQKIGQNGSPGPQGQRGPAGPQGAIGPAVHSVAMCAEANSLGLSPTCTCNNRTLAKQSGACTVTSDTGTCSAATAGCCAVCSP